jgi:hypothetical protein
MRRSVEQTKSPTGGVIMSSGRKELWKEDKHEYDQGMADLSKNFNWEHLDCDCDQAMANLSKEKITMQSYLNMVLINFKTRGPKLILISIENDIHILNFQLLPQAKAS